MILLFDLFALLLSIIIEYDLRSLIFVVLIIIVI